MTVRTAIVLASVAIVIGLTASVAPAGVDDPSGPAALRGGDGALAAGTFSWLKGEFRSMVCELRKGGKTMIFLGFLSVMGLAFLFEWLFRLRQRAIVPKGLAEQADRLWKQGKVEETEDLCRRRPSTLGRVIRFISVGGLDEE